MSPSPSSKRTRIRAPGVTRTPGTQFRKLLLYPPELRGHVDLRDACQIVPWVPVLGCVNRDEVKQRRRSTTRYDCYHARRSDFVKSGAARPFPVDTRSRQLLT